MGKISPVSGKYIISATIHIDGVVEKPDVIGAIFGQTEGLLGADLELRELQRSGRIGRIEVNTTVKSGKVDGEITIPSSLDKAETSIIAAAMEVIERIGPCNSEIRVQKIEDVRVSKRNQVVKRAKELLQGLVNDIMPDSLEIAEEVSGSVKVMAAVEYGEDKLPAGPSVANASEIIIVEGRADVLTLLRYGFKNAIAMNGSNVPQTIIDISKTKSVTVFVDGDRGGDLNVKELVGVAEIDFVVRAPDGKEVEELTKKEIHKALRGRLTPEQFLADLNIKSSKSRNNFGRNNSNNNSNKTNNSRDRTSRNNRSSNRETRNERNTRRDSKQEGRTVKAQRKYVLNDADKTALQQSIEGLLGTKGVALIDVENNILGKVPIKELDSTLSSLKGNVHAVVIDGSIDKNVAKSCDTAKVKVVVGMKADVDSKDFNVSVLTVEQLE